jgi:hypothetical protein
MRRIGRDAVEECLLEPREQELESALRGVNQDAASGTDVIGGLLYMAQITRARGQRRLGLPLEVVC